MLLSKSLAVCLLILFMWTSSAQQCQPKFLIQSALQDVVVLNTFQPDASGAVSEYNYRFTANLFTTSPSALVCIASFQSAITGFNVKNYAEINYDLSTAIQNSTLVLRFKSTNMVWQSVAVNLILHSREDLFSEFTSISVTANIPVEIPSIKQVSSPAESLIVIHNILGITAVYSSNYYFQVDGVQLTGPKGKYQLKSNTNATFIIQTVYFDSLVTKFKYGVEQIVWEGNKADSQYNQVWMDFAPVIYNLYGLTKMTFSGVSLQISTNFDLTNNLLSLKNSLGFSSVEITYFAIGRPSTDVCSPCNNYISVSGCLDQCPRGTYPFILGDGAKTCRQCLGLMNQTVNPNSQGCTCANGQSFFQGNCYSSSTLPLKCSQDQILIDGKCLFKNISQVLKCPQNSHVNANLTSCICDEGYELVNKSCLKACPSHSSRTTFGVCACSYGFIMNSSYLCESICPTNSIYHIERQQCICNYGYQMLNGQCSQCPRGQVYDPSTAKCLAAFFSTAQENSILAICKVNQVAVNGQCVCNQWSIKIGDRCVQCPFATFKQENQCTNCPQFCGNCTNGLSCTQCRRGFNLQNGKCVEICGDGRKFVLDCDDGNRIDGDGCSSSCTVEPGYICNGGSAISTDVCQKINPSVNSLTIRMEPGYPIYTSGAIITNFLVNPPKARSLSQLRKLFKITFNPVRARPPSIILSQLSNDPASIRCFFDYNSALPNLAFTVQFQLSDQTFGSSNLSWTYDTLNNAVTSAIRIDGLSSRGDRLS